MSVTIGVFDSGVGGLTVVKELRRVLPGHRLIYFGDTARTPYGTKSGETISRYALENTRFLLEQGADLIVVACHSAASVATNELKRTFDLPVFEVVTPSVEQALALTRSNTIGLVGTRATVSSGIYEIQIHSRRPKARIYTQACPLLVPLVEEGWLRARETRMIAKKYLRPLKSLGVDTLILGCTHYPLIKDILMEKIGKRVRVVDPSAEVARSVSVFLEKSGRSRAERQEKDSLFFVSDLTPATRDVVRRFLGEPVALKAVSLTR